jgi:hypothetical protein
LDVHKQEEKRAVDYLTSASAHSSSDTWVFNHDMDNDIKVYTRDNPDGSPRAVCGQGLIKVLRFIPVCLFDQTASHFYIIILFNRQVH